MERETTDGAVSQVSHGFRIGGESGPAPSPGSEADRALALFRAGSEAEAMPAIARAAEQGDRRAQYVLATALFNGDHVARDVPAAFAMMRRARDAGLAQAAASLAEMTRLDPEAAGPDTLLSDETVRSCRSLLAKIRPADPEPAAHGDTLHDLVRELLRAELRAPLERLLPRAIEGAVGMAHRSD